MRHKNSGNGCVGRSVPILAESGRQGESGGRASAVGRVSKQEPPTRMREGHYPLLEEGIMESPVSVENPVDNFYDVESRIVQKTGLANCLKFRH